MGILQVGNDAHNSGTVSSVVLARARMLTAAYDCICCDCMLTGLCDDSGMLHVEYGEVAATTHIVWRRVTALPIAAVFYLGASLHSALGLLEAEPAFVPF
jgi:hypothetical protein